MRNRELRTMSGGEPSSIKQSTRCAARAPVLSRGHEDRAGVTFDPEVYGLVLQSGAVIFVAEFADRVPIPMGILQRAAFLLIS